MNNKFTKGALICVVCGILAIECLNSLHRKEAYHKDVILPDQFTPYLPDNQTEQQNTRPVIENIVTTVASATEDMGSTENLQRIWAAGGNPKNIIKKS